MAFIGITEQPPDVKGLPNWGRLVAQILNSLRKGKTNNTGEVTLTANSATTTLTFADGQLGADSVLALFPKTANAAAALTNTYESSRDVTNKTLTLTHTNNAQTDRTFDYTITG